MIIYFNKFNHFLKMKLKFEIQYYCMIYMMHNLFFMMMSKKINEQLIFLEVDTNEVEI